MSNNKESNFIFVAFIIGFVSLVVTLILLFILNNNFDSNEINLKFLFSLTPHQLILSLFMVSFGFFVHGIRYLGFDFYRTIYSKHKETKKYKFIKKIFFYVFRNGTTIEECLKEKRNEKNSDVFDWIKKSEAPARDIWNHSLAIHQNNTSSNIYLFYFHSEIFQCLDTLFLFSATLFPGILIYGFFNDFCLVKQFYLTAFFLILLVFHMMCKAIGKSFIRRFFLEIQIGLNNLP